MDQVKIKIAKVLKDHKEHLHFAYHCVPTISSGTGGWGYNPDDIIYENVAYFIIKELGLTEEYLDLLEEK